MINDLSERRQGHDFVVYKDQIYFSAISCNGLYRCNLDGSGQTFLTYFPNRGHNDKHLHGAIGVVGDKMYFAPAADDCINIYSVGTNEMRSICLENVGTENSKYFDVCVDGSRIYFIPSRANCLIEIDSKTDEVTYHYDCMRGIQNKDNRYPIAKYGSFIREGELYIPLSGDNVLLKINFELNITEKIVVGSNINGFTDSYYDCEADVVWLLECGNSRLFKYSFLSRELVCFPLIEEDDEAINPYIKMVQIDNKLYFIPFNNNKLIVFNMETYEIICSYSCEEDRNINEWNAYYYSAYKIDDNHFVAMCINDKSWHFFDKKGEIATRILFLDKAQKLRKSKEKTVFINESEEVGIDCFIQFVSGNMKG